MFDLVANQELRIVVDGGIGFAQFTYDSGSAGISITRCDNTPIVWKKVKAISLKNAFKSVLSQMTGGKATLNDYYFDNCFFEHYITNNDGLQDEVGRVNVSFFKLFDELNNKYPTSINVRDNIVDIISRCSFYECKNPYNIQLIDAKKQVNGKLLYSSVKVGYNNWKGDSNFASLEYNGKREFQSEYTLGTSSLSLLNDWSASSSIITDQILKRKEKEEIHWIVVNKSTMRAETNECISSNVYDSDRAINMRITPTRNLYRHAKYLLNDLSFASGEGNYNYSSSDECSCDCYDKLAVGETDNIETESIFGNFIYTGVVNICDVILQQLEGCVTFEYCGRDIKGFIEEIKYTTSDYSGQIEITIIELID